jgi:hypothetical protein
VCRFLAPPKYQTTASAPAGEQPALPIATSGEDFASWVK